MRYSQDFIDKVRDTSNIVDEISQFTQLKPSSGSQFVGLCPYPDHNEKSPSFSVSEAQQVYHCFGCKKSGNIFTFLEDFKGFSFPEAMEYLANKAGIPLPKEERPPFNQENQQDIKKYLYKINEFACEFFFTEFAKLPEINPAKKYLHQRGLTKEIIEQFKIGFSPEEWEALVHKLKAQNIALPQAEKLGLIKARSGGKDGFYDLFRGRIIFPIHSHTGQCIGFGGRIVNEGQPKYLNSPESPVFHKGKTFYGLYETAKYIKSLDFAIVVEGYMDFLALYMAGIQNVVATLGTALTEDHARLLKRYTKNVVVMFDGDAAGQAAQERSLPILLSQGLFPRGCTIPNKLDPDDFLKQFGVDALKSLIKQSPELFELVVQKFFQGYRGGNTEKVTIIDKVAPLIRAISDTRLKSLYTALVAEKLAVDTKWLIHAINDTKAQFKPHPKGELVSPPKEQEISNNFKDIEKITVRSTKKSEVYLLNLALKKRVTFEQILNSKILEQISHKGIRQVFQLAQHFYVQKGSEFDKLTTLLVNRVDPSSLVTMHLEEEFQSLTADAEKKLLQDCLIKIQSDFLKNQEAELIKKLKILSAEEQMLALQQLNHLQEEKKLLFKNKNTDMEN